MAECECGCGEDAGIYTRTDPRIGSVKGKPRKYKTGHHLRNAPVMYRVDADTGCWVWQWATKAGGYGMIKRKDATGRYRAIPAHRYIYEQETGRPIPEGKQLDHLCRNPPCVNPAHLEPVTGTENLRRSIAAKLDMAKARHIRSSSSSLSELAQLFGVSEGCIRAVRKGQTWKEPA